MSQRDEVLHFRDVFTNEANLKNLMEVYFCDVFTRPLSKQVRLCADITCLKHETDELVEYLSRHMETLRCGQPAGMTTNLSSLETVGCVDSQPDRSYAKARE